MASLTLEQFRDIKRRGFPGWETAVVPGDPASAAQPASSAPAAAASQTALPESGLLVLIRHPRGVKAACMRVSWFVGSPDAPFRPVDLRCRRPFAGAASESRLNRQSDCPA